MYYLLRTHAIYSSFSSLLCSSTIIHGCTILMQDTHTTLQVYQLNLTLITHDEKLDFCLRRPIYQSVCVFYSVEHFCRASKLWSDVHLQNSPFFWNIDMLVLFSDMITVLGTHIISMTPLWYSCVSSSTMYRSFSERKRII